MPKYIDTDKIEWHTLYFNGGKQEITYKDEIDALPAEDVAQIIHAKLVFTLDGNICCSACGKAIKNFLGLYYCQKCGARMDKEEVEE